ncbi:MAG TPA: hypothetical protein VD948_08880 [Rhodothermales bacterium]|nr:hypothetical protein [Rhodothermales bacterium]
MEVLEINRTRYVPRPCAVCGIEMAKGRGERGALGPTCRKCKSYAQRHNGALRPYGASDGRRARFRQVGA